MTAPFYGRFGDLAASALSPTRRQLVALMQQLNFGRIEGLKVHGGEPILDPMPAVVREHKFAGDNGPHPKAGATDYALKAQVVDLMALLDAIGNGTINTLSVKHGLPFHAELPA